MRQVLRRCESLLYEVKRLKEENYALKSRLLGEAADKVASHRHAAAAAVREKVTCHFSSRCAPILISVVAVALPSNPEA